MQKLFVLFLSLTFALPALANKTCCSARFAQFNQRQAALEKAIQDIESVKAELASTKIKRGLIGDLSTVGVGAGGLLLAFGVVKYLETGALKGVLSGFGVMVGVSGATLGYLYLTESEVTEIEARLDSAKARYQAALDALTDTDKDKAQ